MNLGLDGVDFNVEMLVTPLRQLAQRDGYWSPRAYKKGQTVLKQGNAGGQVFILEHGLVKLVYSTVEGDEWIKSFIVDRGIFGSIDESQRQQPSRFAGLCVEPSIIARLPLARVREAIASDPQMTSAYLAFLGWMRRRKEEREEALLCNSPGDAYRRFLDREPELIRRLPQGDIARFLGVTPTAFSRIKRRMSG